MIYEAEWVLPVTTPAIRNGAVVVGDGGAILDVGRAADMRERHPGHEVTGFHHSILLPGFVNAHVHLDYSVFRGLFDDCDFGEWMLRFILAKRRLEATDYAASALLGAMECVSSGITSIGDTVFDGEATMRAANRSGLRVHAFVEAFGMDDTKVSRVLKHTEGRVARLREIAGPLARVGLSPHAPYTVSGPLYRALTEYARSEGLKVATHVAESRAEVTFIRNGSGVLAHDFRELVGWDDLTVTPTGASPIKYLEQWDAFEGDVIAIHCVQADQADIDVLKRYDVAVAHCPKSNAKLGCGIAPVGALLAAGVRVGLGTDSLASNNILDMFDEMRMSIFLHRASLQSAVCMSAAQALEMATLGGARVLGTEGVVGSIEAGKRADLIAVDMEHSHFAPIDDPVSALVYGANQEDVFFTMIDGTVVYDRKQFVSMDAERVAREADLVRGKLRG